MWRWLTRLFGSAPPAQPMLSAGINRRTESYYANLACGHQVPLSPAEVGAFLKGTLDALACPACARVRS